MEKSSCYPTILNFFKKRKRKIENRGIDAIPQFSIFLFLNLTPAYVLLPMFLLQSCNYYMGRQKKSSLFFTLANSFPQFLLLLLFLIFLPRMFFPHVAELQLPRGPQKRGVLTSGDVALVFA